MNKIYTKFGLLIILFCILGGTVFIHKNVSASPTAKSTDIIIPTLPGAKNKIVAGEDKLTAKKLSASYLVRVILPYTIKLGLQIAAAVAVIFIIVGGYLYVTGAGEEEQYNKAKRTIMYAVVGLLVALLSYVIVDIIASINL